MKIMVTVKQVPDTSGKVAVNPDGTLDRASMQTIINPDDLNAVEAALALKDELGCKVVAFTMGDRLSSDTYDVHFEKAYGELQGAYAMINREFSRMIAEKYPEVQFLNREDDMGSEGLRRAKESYQPTVLLEKYVADWKEN